MRTSLITFILTFIVTTSFADIGNCYKYKVRFELKDNKEITGFYLFPTFDDYFKNINSFDTILSFVNNSWTDSITIIETIVSIDNIRIDDRYYSINALPENSTIKICLEDIIRTKIIDCTPCCKHKKEPEIDNSYIGCSIAVIDELSNYEIDKLKSQRPIVSFIYRDCPDDALFRLVVLSYNKDLNKNDLLEIIKQDYCQKVNNSTGDYFENYNRFKDCLRNDNIIVFKYYW